jgi:hypothetical protein
MRRVIRRVRTHEERGDVPGWVLISVMSAGLVTTLWLVADEATQCRAAASDRCCCAVTEVTAALRRLTCWLLRCCWECAPRWCTSACGSSR